MTVLEMHDYFKILVDKEDTLNNPNFDPEHIDFFLNEPGQDTLVKLRYSGRSSALGQAFEETQKRTDDIRILIENIVIPAEAFDNDNKPNSRFFTLPSNYWFAVNEECTVKYLDCNGESTTKLVRVKPTSHDDYTKVIRDPFSRPNKEEVLRLMYQNKVEIIGSSSVEPLEYTLRYIRKPSRISLSLNVDCELPDHLHMEVVNMAVKSAIRATQNDNEYQKMLNELQQQE